jgi:hypothetical protein
MDLIQEVGSMRFPTTMFAFRECFPDEAACLEYLR